MSYSTTATSTYPLAKYSKSYPTSLQSTSEGITEWQHFTNPSIRLVLDIKKGAQLESVRLRILWSMDSDNDSAQREVVFEDIDLLTFSCLPQRPIQKQQAQGLPLKAVYRDTVVGIRYLHPIEYKDIPVYRRFQITFFSSVSVLEFITAISTICPCKANPTANPAPRMMNPPPVPHQQRQASLAYASSMASQHAPSINSQLATPSSMVPPKPMHGYQVPLLSSSPSIEVPSNVSTIVPVSAEPNATTINVPSTSIPLAHSTASVPLPSFPTQPSQTSANPGTHDLQQQTSLPNSSPPTSSAATLDGPGILSSGTGAPTTDLSSALLSSLRESTQLYDLPRNKLEQLVGEVVREEGFAKLLEDLNSMWAVKSFVGI